MLFGSEVSEDKQRILFLLKEQKSTVDDMESKRKAAEEELHVREAQLENTTKTLTNSHVQVEKMFGM